MYTVLVRVAVKPAARTEFLRGLRALAERGRRVPGCREMRVQTGADDPNEVLLIETFDSVEAYEAHRDSAENREAVGKLQPAFAGAPVATAWHAIE